VSRLHLSIGALRPVKFESSDHTITPWCGSACSDPQTPARTDASPRCGVGDDGALGLLGGDARTARLLEARLQ